MWKSLSVLALFMLSAGCVCAEEPMKILFLSKSAGFEHSTIKEENGEPSHTGTVLKEIAEKMGAEITVTKDASTINAENLKNYNVVIFYTTGDLTTTGTDGHPAMGPEGVPQLLEWIEGGGGFVGFHCATDTFHPTPQCSAPTPYIEAIGGEFASHGPQFYGKLKVVDAEHPVMAAVKDGWTINDEWYCFCNLNEKNMHVLALLDTSEVGKKLRMYRRASYPIIWCSTRGEGRVFYNAMGHREDVWSNEQFQQHVIDALKWADGEGPAAAEPNFAEVVPADKDEKVEDEAAE